MRPNRVEVGPKHRTGLGLTASKAMPTSLLFKPDESEIAIHIGITMKLKESQELGLSLTARLVLEIQT